MSENIAATYRKKENTIGFRVFSWFWPEVRSSDFLGCSEIRYSIFGYLSSLELRYILRLRDVLATAAVGENIFAECLHKVQVSILRKWVINGLLSKRWVSYPLPNKLSIIFCCLFKQVVDRFSSTRFFTHKGHSSRLKYH